ncbi:hypothetical protein CLPUN_25050 [Clostridium puniceum]|uniref:Uncharacterized protein n=1 Tax=Clostridium puniceum TaxID=29367 RepID=A0A1S8TH80_9CLOT|nr:hypothetical protein [Clostridium puniceum]OOM76979.1 hypothetical protein CLPUN_25050 [Clostridium puniceum]
MPTTIHNEDAITGEPLLSSAEDDNTYASITELPVLVDKFLSNNDITLQNPEIIPQIDVQNVSVFANHFRGEESSVSNIVKAESMATLTLGQKEHDIKLEITLESPSPLKQTWDALLQGTIHFGSAQLQIEYNLANPDRLHGKWKEKTGESMTFQDITKALGISHNISINALDLDLRLTAIAFELQLENGYFLLSAQSASFGEVFFIATNANNDWNFVFGIAISKEQITGPLHNFIGGLLNEVNIHQSCCIFSTIEDELFQLPQLPPLPDSTQPVMKFMENWNIKIERGILFCAEILLSESDNPILNLIQSTIDEDSIVFQAPLSPPLTGQRFTAFFKKSINIKVSDNTLTLKNPQLNFIIDPLKIQLEGSLDIPFGASLLVCRVIIEFSDTYAQCSLTVDNQDENGKPKFISAPLGLKGINIDTIIVSFGWIYTTPAMNFGLDGTFHIMDQPVGVNEFGTSFSFVGSFLDPIFFYGYLEQIDLETIYGAITGKNLSGLPAFLNKLTAKQVFLYWSKLDRQLANGTLIAPGAGFNGYIDLFGFKSYVYLIVSEAGIKGSAQAAPYNLGDLLKIGGSGEGISMKEYLVDDEWIILKKEPQQNYQSRMVTYIKPGGALLQFNTNASPYLYASASVGFFDLVDQQIEIEINDQGFRFELDCDIGGITSTKWNCLLNQNTFIASAEFTLDLDIEVGPFKILGTDLGKFNLDIEFKVQATVRGSLDKWELEISGSFMFEGTKEELPAFQLSADINMLKKLPQYLIEQISTYAINNLKFQDADKLLRKAEEAVKEAVNKAEESARALIAETIAETDKIINDAEDFANSIGARLDDTSSKADELLKEAKDILAKGVESVNAINEKTQQTVDDLENQMRDFPSKVAGEIENILNNANDEAKRLSEEGAKVLKNAEEQATEILNNTNAEVKQLGETASKILLDITAEADNTINLIRNETEKTLNDIKIWAEKKAEELKKLGKDPGEPISKIFKKKIRI